MIEKENKIVFRNRLVYSKSPSIIHNNRCRKKIKKTKKRACHFRIDIYFVLLWAKKGITYEKD
jgi:hypothetical protein